MARLKLYRSRENPTMLVGEDAHGALSIFPAQPRGWLRRTPFMGDRSELEEVSPTTGRGTKWPGARGGRVTDPSGQPRTAMIAVTATAEQRARWSAAAAERGVTLAEWVRQACDVYAKPPRARRTKGK